MIFDKLDTADGFEIFWLHEDGDYTVNPDDLYYDEYQFIDTCEHIVIEGRPYVNFAIEENIISEWEKEREETQS